MSRLSADLSVFRRLLIAGCIPEKRAHQAPLLYIIAPAGRHHHPLKPPAKGRQNPLNPGYRVAHMAALFRLLRSLHGSVRGQVK